MRNTHKTIAQSVMTLQEILVIAQKTENKVAILWGLAILMAILGMLMLFKMGRKNSEYEGEDSLVRYHRKLHPEVIDYLFSNLIPLYSEIEFGATFIQLHILGEKVDAAFKAGCRRFDGAIEGYGGCPWRKTNRQALCLQSNCLHFTPKK